jgi:hypothetical protein
MTRRVLLCPNMFYADCTKCRETATEWCQGIISDYFLLFAKRLLRKVPKGELSLSDKGVIDVKGHY